MSAESVARWNTIPLNRPEPDETPYASLKRPRDEGNGDDDSEDNVSLVSRTPSPPPPDAMDVDKYDEYYTSKPSREVITVETKIKSSNIGFSMLAKMGWVEGTPLGLMGDGRVDPVPFYVKNDLTGLGKASQDVRMIESTVSQRRELDSERQTKETEEQRKHREDAVARRAAVQSEITTVLRPFYCEVCEKQFQNVAQYDEHTNSYAHHHKVRFRDMQLAQRANRNTEEEVSKRKEKERKREEKELRKIAKAAGVKMVKPPVAVAAADEASSTPGSGSVGSGGGFKKSGWATVATSTADTSMTSSEPPKRSGWATVGEGQAASDTAGGGGGWAPVSASTSSASAPTPTPPSASAPAPRVDYTSAPAFRTGGWTSLETSNNAPPPPVPAYSSPAAPPPCGVPPPPPSTGVIAPSPPPSTGIRQGWADVSVPSRGGGWNRIFPAGGPPSAQPSASLPPPAPPSASAAVSLRPPPQVTPAEPARQEGSRSGWQKFRAGAPGRRR
ncbi:hypothetical protein V8D89_008115 [Ganoderma adspersum]